MTNLVSRDSADSAPAEYPPDQPEADLNDDDGTRYGEEEKELEQLLIEEEAALAATEGDDMEMEGAEDTAGAKGDESDAESEDLEAPSDSSDDEDEEEEEEGEDGEDVEMGEEGVGHEHAAGMKEEVVAH